MLVLAEADASPLGVSAAEAMSGEPANVAAKMLRTATLNFIRSFQVVNGVTRNGLGIRRPHLP